MEQPNRKPYATTVLLGTNFAVFLAMVSLGVSATQPEVDELLRFGANRGTLVVFEQQWWRIPASMFIHIGVLHLMVNMYSLWRIGGFVERLLGPALFTIVYLLSGLGGALASVLWNPVHVSAGASGAIFGLFGFVVGFALRARNLLPPEVTRSLWDGILTTVAINLFLALSVPYLDNAAHLGGLAIGLFSGLMATDSAIERRGRGPSIMSQAIIAATVVGLGALAQVRTTNSGEARVALTLSDAERAFQTGRLEEADTLASNVLKRDNRPDALILRSQARWAMGDRDGGLVDLNAAIIEVGAAPQRLPVLVSLLHQRASWYQALDRNREAEMDLTRLYEIARDRRILAWRGLSRLRLGDLDGGVQDATLALAAGNGDAIALNNLAWAALHAGVDLELTLSLANASVDLEDTPAGRGTRCWVRAARHEEEFAIPDCEAAVKGANDLLDRGMLAYLRNSPEEAIVLWEQAAQRTPMDAQDAAPWIARARAQLDAGVAP